MISKSIPGRLNLEDIDQLIELVSGRAVFQLGCYCGRGLVILAQHARRVWVLDDFKYPNQSTGGISEELKSNVDRLAPPESKINLLYGTADGWVVPEGSEDLDQGDIRVVYRDANRPESYREADEKLVVSLLRHGGVYAWHDEDGDLKWLKVEPVPVEVN